MIGSVVECSNAASRDVFIFILFQIFRADWIIMIDAFVVYNIWINLYLHIDTRKTKKQQFLLAVNHVKTTEHIARTLWLFEVESLVDNSMLLSFLDSKYPFAFFVIYFCESSVACVCRLV